MENIGEAQVVGESMDYVERLEKKLAEKTQECEGYKREVMDLISNHVDMSRLYTKDYEIAVKKNRKLKKRLGELKEKLKNVGSVVTTMEDWFKLRGE